MTIYSYRRLNTVRCFTVYPRDLIKRDDSAWSLSQNWANELWKLIWPMKYRIFLEDKLNSHEHVEQWNAWLKEFSDLTLKPIDCTKMVGDQPLVQSSETLEWNTSLLVRNTYYEFWQGAPTAVMFTFAMWVSPERLSLMWHLPISDFH